MAATFRNEFDMIDDEEYPASRWTEQVGALTNTTWRDTGRSSPGGMAIWECTGAREGVWLACLIYHYGDVESAQDEMNEFVTEVSTV